MDGATCADDVECASGFCVDGLCCESVCRGSCTACDLEGSEGMCAPIPDGESPRGERDACGAGEACFDGVCASASGEDDAGAGERDGSAADLDAGAGSGADAGAGDSGGGGGCGVARGPRPRAPLVLAGLVGALLFLRRRR